MKTINLRVIDLNLLPILNILLEEKSVTLASRRVHLSQSATSSALRRLRETFNDPILVRRGQQMVASPKALLIQKELNEALAGITDVVTALRSGDILEESLHYTISGPEYVTMTLSDTIRQLLAGTRQTNVNLEPFVRKTIFDHLERGLVDIALGAFGRLKPQFHRQKLYHEHPIMVMRKGHPALDRHRDGSMDVEDFVRYPHLQVTAGEILEDAWITKLLSAHQIERQVTAVLSNISMAPDVLRHTDLLCVGTRRTLYSLPGYPEHLAFLDMPPELDVHDYDIAMVWHERSHDDPDFIALREQILASSAHLHEAV